MLSVEWDPSSLDAELDELLDASSSAVRPAAQAGAQVYYDEMRRRVPVSSEVRQYKGKTYQPGTLKASIYQKYSTDHSSAATATYHVSWNHRKAPHGHLLENGHWLTQWGKNKLTTPVWVPPQSFVRSTYDAVAQRAIDAVDQEWTRRVKEKLK